MPAPEALAAALGGTVELVSSGQPSAERYFVPCEGETYSPIAAMSDAEFTHTPADASGSPNIFVRLIEFPDATVAGEWFDSAASAEPGCRWSPGDVQTQTVESISDISTVNGATIVSVTFTGGNPNLYDNPTLYVQRGAFVAQVRGDDPEASTQAAEFIAEQ